MRKPENGSSTEPRLSLLKVGNRAQDLIQDYKQAIRKIPAVAEALLDLYLSDKPQKGINNLIEFQNGGYRYLMHYEKNDEGEELRITKLPIDSSQVNWDSEYIHLGVIRDNRTQQIIGGGIQSALYLKDNPTEEFTNTTSAVHKVLQFAEENF